MYNIVLILLENSHIESHVTHNTYTYAHMWYDTDDKIGMCI